MKLGDTSSWQSIFISQGSILGLLLFNIALLNYNVSTPSCQPILMTHKYSKQDIPLYGSWRGHWHRSRPRIDKCYEEVEMRQNHKKYKARELEKTTDNPGVKSDITV